MALVHKALAVQKKERAKLAEEQAKLAVVEARLDELASIMEKMQEVELVRCERLGRGQAVIEYLPSDDKGLPIIRVSLPPLYNVTLTCSDKVNGEETHMFIEDRLLIPVSNRIRDQIHQLYHFFLKEK